MNTSKIGRPQVISDDERRALILAAAEQVFDRRGFGETSMQEVAAAAGMAKKTVYKFFPDKMALFEALVVSHDIFQDPASLRDQTEPGGIDRALERVASFILSPRQVMLTRLVIAEARKSPELAKRFHVECMAKTRLLLEAAFEVELARGTGDVRKAHELANMAIGATIGVLHLDALMLQIDRPQLDAEIERRVRLIMQTFKRLIEAA